MKLPTATQKNRTGFGNRRPCLQTIAAKFVAISFVLMFQLEVAAQPNDDGLSKVRVRLVNGSSIRATIDTINNQGHIAGSEILQGITLDQILTIEDRTRGDPTGRGILRLAEIWWQTMVRPGYRN